MDKAGCKTCQFFTRPGVTVNAYGDCVRFPTPIVHLETHWCGEFREKRDQQFKEPAKPKK